MTIFASADFTGITAGTALTTFDNVNWSKHPNSGASTINGAAAAFGAGRLMKSTTSSADAVYVWDSSAPSSADYEVRGDIIILAGGVTADTRNFGIIGRASVAALTFYTAVAVGSNGWQLYKAVAGTFTQLGSSVAQTWAAGTYALALRMVGAAISVKVNGATVIGPITDSAITAAGLPGLRVNAVGFGASTAGFGFDNFAAEDNLGGGPAFKSAWARNANAVLA
jgi:hypothetical protein